LHFIFVLDEKKSELYIDLFVKDAKYRYESQKDK